MRHVHPEHHPSVWTICSEKYCAALGFSVWCIESIGNVPAGKRIRVCACEKAKPVVTRGAKPRDLLASWEVAWCRSAAAGQQCSALTEGEGATLRRTQPYEPTASPIMWVASWQGVQEVWAMNKERFDKLTRALATGQI
jgi:hypothetical protein